MKKNKNYTVNIDMKWSKDYKIKAATKSEAKKIAWERFKKSIPKDLFELSVDEDPFY